ncbi:hypothetical protein, partial [Limosilactobacillus reuteri]|uniref:hypothetical protein n=1 Tax=Limosilactobacillus reuteri TaxID=1598 RepID=UPI00207C5C9F
MRKLVAASRWALAIFCACSTRCGEVTSNLPAWLTLLSPVGSSTKGVTVIGVTGIGTGVTGTGTTVG